jgi:hypothetical protein
MSYILDALKKVERERGVPPAPTSPISVPQSRVALKNRTLVLVLGGTLCTAAALWILPPVLKTVLSTRMKQPPDGNQSRLEERSQPEYVPNPASVQPASSAGFRPESVGAATTGTVHANPGSVPNEARPHAASKMIPSSRGSSARLDAKEPSSREADRSIDLSSPTAAGSDPSLPVGSSSTGEAESAGKKAAMQPVSLQEAKSRMNITLIMYGEDEADRFVFINGKKYVKGDHVDGLYLIEEISLEGVTLSYNGERVLLHK